MKLTSSDRADIAPGDLVRWHVEPVGRAESLSTPLSENETFHLASNHSGTPGWIALTLDYARPVARAAVDRVMRTLIERHDMLRSHFAAVDGGFTRVGYSAARVVAREVRMSDAQSGPAFADGLMSQIAGVCNPLRPMPHYLAAVERPDSTTVILAFDHCYVDARALAVLGAETDELLAGRELGKAESGLATMSRTIAHDAGVTPDDWRLRGWHDFLAAADWRVPEFPLELGLPAGDTAPTHTQVRTLLPAEPAERLSSVVHQLGGRTYPAVLTCAGTAIARLGGPAELGVVIPVPVVKSSRAVAWLVGSAPLRVDCAGAGLSSAVQVNTARLADALPLAEIGLTPVYQAYGDRLRRARSDVFMMSYVDYTRLPGADVAATATQISSEKQSDTAQWWFWRDHAGIHVRVRHPHTEQAGQVIARALEVTAALMRDLAGPPPNQSDPVAGRPGAGQMDADPQG